MPKAHNHRIFTASLMTVFLVLGTNSFGQPCVDAIERSSFEPQDPRFIQSLLDCFDELRSTNQRDSIYKLEGILLAARNASELGERAEQSMELNFRLGLFYSGTNDQTKAISSYISALKYAEDLKDSTRMARILSSLGILNYSFQRWREALAYFNRADKIIGNSLSAGQKSTTLYLIGLCYQRLDLDSASRASLLEAQRIAQSRGDSDRVFECTLGLASLETAQGNFDDALDDYEEALAYYKFRQEPIALAYVYNGMAEAYAHKGMWDEVQAYSEKAYELSSEAIDSEPVIESLRLRALAYEEKNEFDKALSTIREYQGFKDSLQTRDVSAQIALASSEYDFEKRELTLNQQIKEDKQKRQVLAIFTALMALLVLMALYAYYSVRKERRKSEDLLLNILPRQTAEELKRYGTAISKKHEGVCILFCDAKGFTTISEKLKPEELVDMIDHYFRAFDEIIEKHGIEKIKTIGDAYMCVSGLGENPAENPANAMASAAIEMLAASKKVSRQMNERYGFGFTFRFGIHYGDVVSGVVGFRKYAYDVWGDAVNLAARMEQSGEPGWINISGDMYEKIKGTFQCTYRGKITAKNKGDVDMYFLEAESQLQWTP